MHQRSRQFGWCLLIAASLTWFGCEHSESRHAEDSRSFVWDAVRPGGLGLAGSNDKSASAGVDPVANNPRPEPAEEPMSRPSLLPPVSERDLPRVLPEPARNDAATPLRSLYRQAAERFAATPAYAARLVRRELVDGKQRPEEQIQVKYRREPASLYLRWLGEETKNREVLYVKGRYDDMLQIMPGNNDPLGLPAALRRPLARPDSGQGLGKERYPVRETGIGALIDRFGKLADAVQRGDNTVGTIKYLGPVKRPEFEAQVDAVMHVIPPGVDGRLPKGGQRLWYFDTSLRLPVLVLAHDAQGHEAEYYCYDRFLFPTQIAEEDFDPTKLGRR